MTTTSTPKSALTSYQPDGGLAKILQTAPSDTLLEYAALVNPDPLQVNGRASITLAVSAPSGRAVRCKSIMVTLSVGSNAKNLTASVTALELPAPDGWQSSHNGGVITFTPVNKDGFVVGGDGLELVIAGFVVNDQIGTTPLIIDETASPEVKPPQKPQPAQTRSATIKLPKFPEQFIVSDLQADPLDVGSGGTTVLNWRGPKTGPGGTAPTYELRYQPGNQGAARKDPVGNTGPKRSEPLTRRGAVSFALVVTVKVPGQDEPLIVNRYAIVAVQTLFAELAGEPAMVGVNGLVHLTWSTDNAVSCRIDPDIGDVSTSGERWLTLRESQTFTLTAKDKAGNSTKPQFSVAVSSRIKATETGHTLTGGNGGAGGTGSSSTWVIIDPGKGRNPQERKYYQGAGTGQTGSAGGDAKLTIKLPPLDPSSSPTRVIPITLTGGRGGTGGQGGENLMRKDMPSGQGGNGGRGGSVVLNATLDANAGAPAQYIVLLTPGAGGSPGQTGRTIGSNGSSGNQGPAGVATLNITEEPS